MVGPPNDPPEENLAFDVLQLQIRYSLVEEHHNCHHGIHPEGDLEKEIFLSPLEYADRTMVEFVHDEEERNETRLDRDESRGHSFCLRRRYFVMET